MTNVKEKSIMASYVGLEVQVLVRMEAYSLILCRGRKVVVETADLRSSELSLGDRSHPLSVQRARASAGVLNGLRLNFGRGAGRWSVIDLKDAL